MTVGSVEIFEYTETTRVNYEKLELEVYFVFFNEWQVLSCRSEVQSELVQQVLLLMASHKQLGMVEICEFLKPFLNYSILGIPFLDTPSSMFARHLISSMTSFCCLYPSESLPVLKLLTEALKYVPCQNSEASHLLLIRQRVLFVGPICCTMVGVIVRILESIFISTQC